MDFRRPRNTDRRLSFRKLRHGMESLESRQMLTVSMTDYEQLVLELVNRARQDPLAEVARNTAVNDLNAGLAAGTISTAPKQPLAPIQSLITAAALHSQDMIDNDFFAHNNLQNQTPTQRAQAQGYPGSVGENIGWMGYQTPVNHALVDPDEITRQTHNNLFESPSHRANMMTTSYRENGMGVAFGFFTSGNNTYDAVMVSEEFGFGSGDPYLTGVAYTDDVLNDDFYSVGESEAELLITAVPVGGSQVYSTASGPSGGYALKVPAGTYTVTATGGSLGNQSIIVSNVSIGGENKKLDFEFSTATITPNPPTGPDAREDLVGVTLNDFWVAESGPSAFVTKAYGELDPNVTFGDFRTGDFNGDGYSDVAARSGADGGWWIARSTGSGTFQVSKWGGWSTSTTWNFIQVGDFNGDGKDDLAGRTSAGQWWVAKSTGTALQNQYWGAWSNATTWTDVKSGDFNGDQKTDIIGRATDGTWWVAQAENNRFVNRYYGKWSNAVTWVDVRVGDFNGDGRDDVAGRTSGQWWVNRSNTNNSFLITKWGAWSNNVTWTNVVVGDFDGDGDDDLAGRANGDWWVANSQGITPSFINQSWRVTWTSAGNWQDVVVADVNGDGRDDIAGRLNGEWWVARASAVESRFQNVLMGTWSTASPWTTVLVGNFS